MPRSSPGVRRVAAILNFIAEHPGQAFTMTDLVKALKLSRATCHALLTGLVEVGYLYRASDKNYVLGPTLASIGRIASQHASPLQIAQPEMRALSDEFDLMCSAFFRDRDHIVVRDRASSVSHVGWSVAIGTRLPLTPSLGSPFHSWLPQEEVDVWLDAFPQMTPGVRRTVVDGMGFLREHGFQVHVRNPVLPQADRGGGDHPDALTAFPTLQLASIDDARTYPVDAILSPVFELRGQIAFALGLTGFAGARSGTDVRAMGNRLRDACGRVTTFITGQSPRFAFDA